MRHRHWRRPTKYITTQGAGDKVWRVSFNEDSIKWHLLDGTARAARVMIRDDVCKAEVHVGEILFWNCYFNF